MIDGTGFPLGMDTEHVVVVSFTDGTPCVIQAMTETQITCLSDPFVSGRRRRLRMLSGVDITIDVNGKTVE